MALAAAFALATTADAQERVRWKMQSAFPGNLPHTGVAAKRLEAMVDRLSGGNFELKFYEPGALVPPLECFDAAAKGSVESCYSPAAFHTGKYPALAFFTTMPFGPQYGEFFAWKIYGGGDELQKEIYDRHGLTKIDCGATGPETSGWFREKVGSLADLKGLKMRFLGLGAQVMQKLGVSTQLLAPPDIYPALERGVIDATEFAMPDMDIELGFYQIAKYNYYPGWHQPVSIGELLMNKAAFEALPDDVPGDAGGRVRLERPRHLRRVRGDESARDERDAGEIRGPERALDRRGAGGVRDRLGRGAGGAGGGRPDLQEGRRQLSRVPQGVQGVGRRSGARGDLPEQVSWMSLGAPARRAS